MSIRDSISRTNSRKTSKVPATDTIVRRKPAKKNVPFLSESVVPAGRYVSEIVAVYEAVTDKGKAAVDVHYSFTDAHGNVVEAKERFAIDGFYFEQLCEALLDAGLSDGAKISQAVGITESVDVTYPRPGAIGRIKTRTPYAKSVSNKSRMAASAAVDYDDSTEDVVEDDDEFDDFADGLDDEDE